MLASALLHVLVLLAFLLRLPEGDIAGAGGMAVDVVYDVPGEATLGDGQDAAAEAAPAPAPETPTPPRPEQQAAVPEPPTPEPPPEPVSDVPDPTPVKPPPPKPRPAKPPVPKPVATPAPAAPPAARTVPAALPGSGTGAVTTGEGQGTAAGAADPNAAAGDLAGDGGPAGNGVPRIARGKDLAEAEMRNRLIGNTLSGMMGSRDGAAGRFDVEWQAYVRPDGTVIARVHYKAIGKKGTMEERVVTEKGIWTLENGTMCLKFEKQIDFGAKDCFRVQDVDRKMAFYYASCPYHASDRCNSGRLGQFGEVLSGNAFGL
ncbi:hypothetical protein DES42_101485 [Zavarzinia compransoris]|nr:hypothetical protein DES42_101485 [Zavarzinia compransoris]